MTSEVYSTEDGLPFGQYYYLIYNFMSLILLAKK